MANISIGNSQQSQEEPPSTEAIGEIQIDIELEKDVWKINQEIVNQENLKNTSIILKEGGISESCSNKIEIQENSNGTYTGVYTSDITTEQEDTVEFTVSSEGDISVSKNPPNIKPDDISNILKRHTDQKTSEIDFNNF